MARNTKVRALLTVVTVLAALLAVTGCVYLQALQDPDLELVMEENGGEFVAKKKTGGRGSRPPVLPLKIDDATGTLSVGAGLGYSVALAQDSLAVGLPSRSGPGDGSAFVYGRPPSAVPRADISAGDDEGQYGASVAMSEDYLVVGANLDRVDGRTLGAVYVYDQPYSDGQAWSAMLTPGDGEVGALFGASVAVDGDLIAVGAPSHKGGGPGGLRPGAVYVYRRLNGNWVEDPLLPAPADEGFDPDGGAEFGTSVALSGDTLVVGSPYENDRGNADRGAAHVFRRIANGWLHSTKLLANPTRPLSRFGAAVDIDGDTIVVGADYEDSGKGAGYVFVRDTFNWEFEARVAAADGVGNDSFGRSAAVMGDRAVFGAPGVRIEDVRAGAAYLYTRAAGAWTQAKQLVATDPTEAAQFGVCLDLLDDTAAVGAPSAVNRHGRSGAVYVYAELPGPASSRPWSKAPAPDPRNEYLAFHPRPGAVDPASACLKVPRDLWTPFTARLTAGAFDEEKTDGLEGGTLSFGVEQVGSEPAEYYEVRGEFAGGGLKMTARTRAGAFASEVVFSGTSLVDLEIERVGLDLVLSARPRGAETMTEVGRVPFVLSQVPYHPYVRIEGIRDDGEIGFDDPLFTNGTAPDAEGEPTPSELIYQAIEGELSVTSDLDADEVDGETEETLSAAGGKLEAALAAVRTLARSKAKKGGKKGPRRAMKQIRKSSKKVRRARKKLAKGKPGSAVRRRIEEALKSEVKALAALGG